MSEIGEGRIFDILLSWRILSAFAKKTARAVSITSMLQRKASLNQCILQVSRASKTDRGFVRYAFFHNRGMVQNDMELVRRGRMTCNLSFREDNWFEHLHEDDRPTWRGDFGINRSSRNRRVNTLIDPKKIANFCFLVILCHVWCSLQHTRNRTKSKNRKVSNFEVDFIDL